jgi:hypothetical protein
MASASSVLAVIRAAHPELKSKQDRLAFAIHATLLASGYRLVGTGAAEADPEEGRKCSTDCELTEAEVVRSTI